MSEAKIINPTIDYSRGFNGSAQAGILVRGDGTDPSNIAARCSNINWNIPLPVSQVDEVNTSHVLEVNAGRQDLVTGRIGLVMTLKSNDALPTSRTNKKDVEGYTLFIATGDDHKLTEVAPDGTMKRVITDVFIGVTIVNKAGGMALQQTRMTDVSFAALDHFTGGEWKLKNPAVKYPADSVVAV